MDKGAHFFRSDFQVHTPRDRNWQGGDAFSDDDRKLCAGQFVAACRSKGLHAVGITDHHDMAFVPYLRAAAASELTTGGKPLASADRLVIFPGMELTLGIPCQALLLFDANFPDDLFSLVLSALAITQAPSSESKHHQAVRLDRINTFPLLHQELDKHTYLRGRYIVLPNVSEGGRSTLLRSGHAGHYREMPCIGGYLDGPLSKLGDGNINILSGQNQEYGNKRLALFQSSDSRRRDFDGLGLHSTWVKWAVPTAEALRQACLASESRISQTQPGLPAIAISSISVSNSRFMGPIELELNPQYNAIIGGRGTGKSTILEYLRWGVCDQPPAISDDDDAPDVISKRKKLIDRTLTPLEAVVQVRFLSNGIPHIVRRHAKTNELLLKIGDGEFQPCKESDVQGLLPIQAYSQKQLSNVGVRLEELNRLLCSPVQQELASIDNDIRAVSQQLRSAYVSLERRRELLQAMERESLELNSLAQQVQALRQALIGISDEDRETISEQSRHEDEDQLVKGWLDYVRRIEEAIGDFNTVVSANPPVLDIEPLGSLPNAELLGSMQKAIGHFATKMRELAQTPQAELDGLRKEGSPFPDGYGLWARAQQAFQEKYNAAKSRSSAQQSQLQQLSQLEGRAKQVRESVASRQNSLSSSASTPNQYAELRQRWRDLQRQRADVLERQCLQLTKWSHGELRVTLKRGANTVEIEQQIRSIVTGQNIRGQKIETLLGVVRDASSPSDEWEAMLDELHILAIADKANLTQDKLPSTWRISQAGLSTGDIIKIAAKITPETWLELSLQELQDEPVFEYRSREAEYMSFADASAGQQATALLTVLLNQEGPPLVIDQPEDDLDNQVILRIVEQIWDAKKKRQLIFSSHNANLVVNGDSELVVCCDYRVTGDQSGGHIKKEGAIDIGSIRDEITAVMEGGKEAFKLRKDKYGF